jgi:hypothetical protein
MTNPYIRFVQPGSLLIADFTNLTTSLTTTWANSASALAWNATLGAYPVTIPAWLPNGEWDCLVYDNAAPANTDEALPQSKRFLLMAGAICETAQKLSDA